MRYALIADVIDHMAGLQDPLDAFLEKLPEYQNAALAVHWSEDGEPTLFARDFGDRDEGPEPPLAFRQLRWRRVQRPKEHLNNSEEHFRWLQGQCADINARWVDVLDNRRYLQRLGLGRSEISKALRPSVVDQYSHFGLPLQFGVLVPGRLISHQFSSRYVEIYYFEPPHLSPVPDSSGELFAVSTKLAAILPLLNEVALVDSSAEQRGRRLIEIVGDLVFHEVENALWRRTGGVKVPDVLKTHIGRCLDAYRHPGSGRCASDGWSVLASALRAHFPRETMPVEITAWPDRMPAIGLSTDLLYVISCELIKNAYAKGAKMVVLSLDFDIVTKAAILAATSDGEFDLPSILAHLQVCWQKGSSDKKYQGGGLGIIMQLLRVLRPSGRLPIEASPDGAELHIKCYLPLAMEGSE
jgi:hypothetical protein